MCKISFRIGLGVLALASAETPLLAEIGSYAHGLYQVWRTCRKRLFKV